MFLAPSPTLQSDETLIKSGSATWHGYNKSCVFALTNKRLIFKTLYDESWFPLSRLKSVSRTGIFLNFQFDNGFSTTASVSDAEQFETLIEQAKVNAPEMEYQPGKASQTSASFISTRTLIILLIAGGLIGLCALVFLATIAVFYFLS